MSRYSSSITRHASRQRRGAPIANLTFAQRQEQRRLDAQADGHLFVPARSPEQIRQTLSQPASVIGSADAF